ncbi:hypothetical protein F5148DRAFT_1368825 [Russula earlei]|uniref:Uncharacterized protein n=1 Tax=Russula earlei TaxID=71964 RepID=A0ACC0U5Y6_9AGAM|nr:hypothetical protein F5148DRAFT_1368825 [Russula earlei]
MGYAQVVANSRRDESASAHKGSTSQKKGFGEGVPGPQQKLDNFLANTGKQRPFGSVFTEFLVHKGAEAFLNADPKPSWDGKDLLIMSKEAFVEMKIKEKGLKGKAAVVKGDHITRKGFDAFREEEAEAEPEIFITFLERKLRVEEGGGGSVGPEEVPRIRGSALRFTGCGGEVSYDKHPSKERFRRAPFVKFTKGDDAGLVGFDRALGCRLCQRKCTNTSRGSNPTSILFVHALRPLIMQRRKNMQSARMRRRNAHLAVRTEVFGEGVGGNSRGRRGGGGRRGGRADWGTRGGKTRSSDNGAQSGGDEQTGEKRKRAVEPEGGPDAGVR